MPKYYCDYCDVFLTHDSSSVRKAHNAGRNHLTNVKDYYAGLGHDKAQDLIDEITKQYERGDMRGRPPMGMGMGMGGPPIGFGGPPPGGFGGPPPGFPGFGPPPGDFGGPPPFSGPPPSRNNFVPPEPNQLLGKPPIETASSGPAKPPFINPERAAALGL